jgi:prephenate dehydrogenase
MKKFRKVAIIGVGLIGGSIGLAIKRKKLARQVVGVARKNKTLRDALRIKAVDKVTRDIAQAVKGADLVILCQPIEAIITSFSKISPFLKGGAIVTDVGSCKEEIVKTAQKLLPRNVFFVGSHPLAGSEKKGALFASEKMFCDSLCILTPTPPTNKKAFRIIRELWHRFGAKTFILKPSSHDRVVAFISHLPHMLAFSLINSIPAEYLKFSSTGLKDTTRIASSDSTVWKDICLFNSAQILKAINNFEIALKDLKRQISKKYSSGLMKAFSKAQKKRNNLNAC